MHLTLAFIVDSFSSNVSGWELTAVSGTELDQFNCSHAFQALYQPFLWFFFFFKSLNSSVMGIYRYRRMSTRLAHIGVYVHSLNLLFQTRSFYLDVSTCSKAIKMVSLSCVDEGGEAGLCNLAFIPTLAAVCSRCCSLARPRFNFTCTHSRVVK